MNDDIKVVQQGPLSLPQFDQRNIVRIERLSREEITARYRLEKQVTETSTFEWVDEVPSRSGGGKAGGGKYASLVEELGKNAGKIAKLGPMGQGAASGAVARLKELGANATSRTVDGEVFVFTHVATDEVAPEDHNSEGMFEGEDG